MDKHNQKSIRFSNLLKKTGERFFSLFKKANNCTKDDSIGSPDIGKINFGDLRRLDPISRDWGFSRGGPVDRYYIESFLKDNSSDIQGRALEIKDDHYLRTYGGNRVTQFDILDVTSENAAATVIADLSQADHIASNQYDCIVLTQVLQLIYDVKAVIYHLHRILKPGGVLLLTVPGISHFLYDSYGGCWCWSFTELSIQKMLAEHFKASDVETKTHGNVLVATAFLHGLGSREIQPGEFDHHDPDYQLVITARAVKQKE